MTLVELVVVLVILGIASGIAAFGGLQLPAEAEPVAWRADSLRAVSIAEGRALFDTLPDGAVLYLPDGRTIRDWRQ
jgi:prepilin-type N-terminal cleavage/methylation domain-containing protein